MKPQSIAAELRINLASKQEEELFKWFLVCLLFGKPIQRQVAERAYRELMTARLVAPDAVLRAGWDELVRLLDQAHYVRFDFSTATKLLHVCQERRRATARSPISSASRKHPQNFPRGCRSSNILVRSPHGSLYEKCDPFGIPPARRLDGDRALFRWP